MTCQSSLNLRCRKLMVVFSLAVALVSFPQRAFAHLDPPGPPAFQEVIWLTALTVFDDMDTFGAGELFVNYTIQQPGHPVVTGRIPATGVTSLSAPPPAAAFPGLLPLVIYNHVNCQPLERPFTFTFVLSDNDVTTVETSPQVLVVGGDVGAFGAGNAQFSFTVLIGVFPAPQFNALCAAGAPPAAQPAPPAAPATPNVGPFFPDPQLPPVPEPERPKLTFPTQTAAAVDDATGSLPRPRPLTADIAPISASVVIGIILGLLLARFLRRRKSTTG